MPSPAHDMPNKGAHCLGPQQEVGLLALIESVKATTQGVLWRCLLWSVQSLIDSSDPHILEVVQIWIQTGWLKLLSKDTALLPVKLTGGFLLLRIEQNYALICCLIYNIASITLINVDGRYQAPLRHLHMDFRSTETSAFPQL